MTRVTVRELQQNIRRVLDRVEQGESVEVTRHKRAVARLMPVRSTAKPEPWPDVTKRIQAIFGKRPTGAGAAKQILTDRE